MERYGSAEFWTACSAFLYQLSEVCSLVCLGGNSHHNA